jgi:hypothetical protein
MAQPHAGIAKSTHSRVNNHRIFLPRPQAASAPLLQQVDLFLSNEHTALFDTTPLSW